MIGRVRAGVYSTRARIVKWCAPAAHAGRSETALVPLEGLEPPLLRLEGACFIHLSYRGGTGEPQYFITRPALATDHRRKQANLVAIVQLSGGGRGGFIVDESAAN